MGKQLSYCRFPSSKKKHALKLQRWARQGGASMSTFSMMLLHSVTAWPTGRLDLLLDIPKGWECACSRIDRTLGSWRAASISCQSRGALRSLLTWSHQTLQLQSSSLTPKAASKSTAGIRMFTLPYTSAKQETAKKALDTRRVTRACTTVWCTCPVNRMVYPKISSWMCDGLQRCECNKRVQRVGQQLGSSF